MNSPHDTPDAEAPDGWAAEEASDEARSWLGEDERVLCTREGDGWIAYVQPRGELGTAHQVPLTEEPTDRDGAVSTAREYMAENGE